MLPPPIYSCWLADVLQRYIQFNGGVRHPLTDDACPVLQYANDTLIVVRAEIPDVRNLGRV